MARFWASISTFFAAQYKWLLVALIVPFMTFGAEFGWSALNPYHASELEHALDTAPFYWVLTGATMVLPSLLVVLIGLMIARFLLRPSTSWRFALVRFLFGTLLYAFFMALMYGLADGWMTAYGPMEQHSAEAYRRSFFMERLFINLIFWTPANWIATLACMALISMVSRICPKRINRRQKLLTGIVALATCALVVCPPWWVHDYVLSVPFDESTGVYYEGYLGHAPLFKAPAPYKFSGQELDSYLCTQQLMLELFLLFIGSIVLSNVLGLKHLEWRALKRPQQVVVIIGLCSLLCVLVYVPWWRLTGMGCFWGEKVPMTFLGYAPTLKCWTPEVGRCEIIWTLVGLEAYLIIILTGAVILFLQKPTDKLPDSEP